MPVRRKRPSSPRVTRSSSPRQQQSSKQQRRAPLHPLASFALVLGAVFVLVWIIFSLAPAGSAQACSGELSFLWLIGQVASGKKNEALLGIKDCVKQYNEDHPNWLMALYVVTYVTMQAFAIPGPIVLSLVTGAMWELPKSLLLISLCATGGASACYLLSQSLQIGGIFERMNPRRYEQFRQRVALEEAKNNLIYYMLFLRLTPLMPNWFINLMSPYAGVPLRTFALATAVGLIPANTLHYYSGKAIANMAGNDDNFWRNLGLFLVLQVVALLPTFFKGKLEQMDRAAAETEKGRATKAKSF